MSALKAGARFRYFMSAKICIFPEKSKQIEEIICKKQEIAFT